MKPHHTEKSIIKALQKADVGLTIEEVSKALSINRITAAKYLLILAAKGACTYKQIGKAKLFYIPRKTHG